MTTDQTPELVRLGDDLERAAAADLEHGRHRRRTIRTAGLVAAFAVLATGTAAVAGVFTPKQVAAGMPAGAAIFGQADPTCVLDADDVTYHCTLARTPEDTGPVVTPPPGKDGGGADAVSYLDSKETLAIGGVIAGGCIGRSEDGLRWDCYIGQPAVDREILTQDFLGQPAGGPSRG
jgi:hypothetical protein